jgi:hypothetical protein
VRLFSAEHEAVDRCWYEGSNNLVLLQVSGEQELLELREKADDCPSALFREPDLDGEATAMAMGPAARKFVSNLPLLLKGA